MPKATARASPEAPYSTTKKSPRFDWHVPLIGGLLLLLWTTNRRRIKPNFELSGDGSIDVMVPSLIGLTEGAVDAGNRVEILQNGRYFERLLEDIAAARQSIHIESYIWWTGDICERIADALAARARDVEIRLLLDYSGSSRMDAKLMQRMREAGCKVRHFHPLRVSNIGVMNNRTHRKIAVFDGRVAYVGGHGIAEEWTGNAEDKDHWRDTFVRMEGPVANTVQGCFCENWIEETGEVPVGERYYPKLERCGETDAHVAYTSPHGSISSVQMLYYLAISSAHKELLIQNPYFLPHEDAIEALIDAVRRGVDVQIMLPSASVIDTPIVQHASHHHFGDLLKAGVRIFEYQKTLLHQKVIIVDGAWSCVGSTNFDDRSFQRNDEITVGFTDRDVAQTLREAFFDDMKHARAVQFDEWRSRPWHHKLIDGFAFAFRTEL